MAHERQTKLTSDEWGPASNARMHSYKLQVPDGNKLDSGGGRQRRANRGTTSALEIKGIRTNEGPSKLRTKNIHNFTSKRPFKLLYNKAIRKKATKYQNWMRILYERIWKKGFYPSAFFSSSFFVGCIKSVVSNFMSRGSRDLKPPPQKITVYVDDVGIPRSPASSEWVPEYWLIAYVFWASK